MKAELEQAQAIVDAIDACDQERIEQACEQALTDMFFAGEDVQILAHEWDYTPECTPELARKVARRLMHTA